MKLFKCHNHKWEILAQSNALQQDSMGYPLRLCIVECSKCGQTDQMWLDAPESALEEIESGKSFLVEWR